MVNTIEPSARPAFHRRRYLVDRRMQLDLAVRSGLAVGVLLVAMGFALFMPMARKLERETDPLTRNDVGTALLYLHANYWPLVIGSVALAFAATILISHRIAGPLVRVRRGLAELTAGRLPAPMRIRRRDHLGAEVDLLNQLAEKLDADARAVRGAEDGLRAALAAAGVGDTGVAAAIERLGVAVAALPRGAEGDGGPQSMRAEARDASPGEPAVAPVGSRSSAPEATP